MVHVPTRGDAPVRLGPAVRTVPDYGPRKMRREPYTDPMQFELERQRVLNTTWLLAGRSSQIAAPGDWISFESHGETVVVTRQRDGGLAAFHNVCQHRGVSFVTEWQGCGARRFTCPYHGWVYDTTGKLVGVPEKQDFAPEHLADVRAPAVAADEWGGWVWVNLAGPDMVPPLRQWIGDDILTDLGRYRMEDMVLLDVLEWDVPVSYKAIVDGFNEIYHTAALHHVAPEWTKSARDTSFHIVNDHNYMCFVPRYQHRDQLAEDWDHHRWAICHYVVFPNTVFNCNPEHIQVFNPIPIEVDRTRFLCWEIVYPGDESDPGYAEYRARMQAHWDHLKVVVGEDIGIYEQLARTKRSSAYRENILSERECKIAHYHETMARMISE
ncbi:MAG TPA: aromatic ring-hydroxylating dioxygenase subunit alpha [Acidimicrobiales bacterium]|jgi:phenylpropionate dioxygenase-like ring-hydroxylating dioxygenase large terminal subunit|nr:aromatic ring-hydroxylating dioxygenase subunit alpha [Acidimicrobiales bacterium]